MKQMHYHFLFHLTLSRQFVYDLKPSMPKKHIPQANGYISTRCPWCHNAEETDEHVLFSCDFARTVWYAVGLNQVVQPVYQETAFKVLRTAFEVCTRDQCVQIAMVSWSIWNRRNNWVWNKINGSAYGVKAAATSLSRDWREAQKNVSGKSLQENQGDRVWKKPEEGWLKINMDAVIFCDGSIGIGSIIRDSRGCFIGARRSKVEGAWSPREVKAISMKEVSSCVLNREYSHCVFETDSKCLVDACNGFPGEAFFGTIVLDCVHLLKHINPVLVQFSYRSANRVAHELAKAAYSMSDIGVWYAIPPNFISHVLEVDNS